MNTNEQLNDVIHSQDVESLVSMIENGVRLNELDLSEILVDYFGSDEKVNEAFVKLLIDHEIQIQTTRRTLTTSLMLCAALGLDSIITDLISRGFDLNEKNLFGMNAFHWAVAYGQFSTAKMLIEKGADVYAKASFKVSYVEKVKTKEERLRTLIDYDETEKYQSDELDVVWKYKTVKVSAFAIAFNSYSTNIIQLLLEKGFNPNEDVLSENSFLKFFEENEVAHENSLNKRAVSVALYKNDVQTLKLLIEYGATNLKKSDLVKACEKLNFEMIKLLVENGVETNKDTSLEDYFDYKRNPLSIVCRNSAVEPVNGNCASKSDISGSEVLDIIKYLIEHGADVNIDSPLMAACSLKYDYEGRDGNNEFYADINTDVINLLLEKGADVNFANENDGHNILMEAIKRINGYELAKILVHHGVDVNHKDRNQNSCLFHLDSEYHHAEYQLANILTLLLNNGANIHIRNNMGMTPLMHYALKGEATLVKILLEHGADINAKSEMTAYDLAQSDEIKTLIQESRNNTPQKLVKILSNFTIDKPIKYTTHSWDFGELKKEYGNFDGYMSAVKKQFDGMKEELEKLSPNLYQKIYTFLIEENPDTDYSWCQKANINIGWSSLKGLREWCDSGKKAEDFQLMTPIPYNDDFETIKLKYFRDVINLFKQEIEIRDNFSNLENLFANQIDHLGENFILDLTHAKLNRQFYTDTEKFSNVLDKIFSDISTRQQCQNIEVITIELEDRSIEIRITQINSDSGRSARELYDRASLAGDISEIKNALTNLCDWSVESSYQEENFRANFLHSNNVKEIEILDSKPKGFTHILRFYK